MFYIMPGTHETIDLDHCTVDPDFDDTAFILDQIIEAAERLDDEQL